MLTSPHRCFSSMYTCSMLSAHRCFPTSMCTCSMLSADNKHVPVCPVPQLLNACTPWCPPGTAACLLHSCNHAPHPLTPRARTHTHTQTNRPPCNPLPPAAEPIRVSLDPGGVVAMACHADGSLHLHHLPTGKVLWKAWGHGDVVTAAMVASDLERLVSVSGDGCVFVWRLPEALATEVKAAAARVAAAQRPRARSVHDATAAAAADGGVLGSPGLWAVGVAKRNMPSREVRRKDLEGTSTVSDLAAAILSPSEADRPSTPSEGRGGAAAADLDSSSACEFLTSMMPTPADSSPEKTGRRGPRPKDYSTPGSCASGGVGVSQTILRVQAGRPLVPCARLPLWAARQVSPSPDKFERRADARIDEAGEGQGWSGGEEGAGEAAAAAVAAGAAGADAGGAPVVGGKWALTMQRGASPYDVQLGFVAQVRGWVKAGVGV